MGEHQAAVGHGAFSSASPFEPVLALLVTLGALYALGSYATSRLAGLSVGKGPIRASLFYGIVAPGVMLHESAHLIACLLTGTRVSRFSPFSPERAQDGRILLGRVEHEGRGAPVEAIIGLMPVLVNPIGVVAVTAWLTPIPAEALLLAGTPWEAALALASALAGEGAVTLVVWAYLAGSFALGAVPSREDLASVPAALLLVAGAAAVLWATGLSEAVLPSGASGASAALAPVARAVTGMYALPVAVAALAAAAAAFASSGRARA